MSDWIWAELAINGVYRTKSTKADSGPTSTKKPMKQERKQVAKTAHGSLVSIGFGIAQAISPAHK